jgi:dephospho-CoA kinase
MKAYPLKIFLGLIAPYSLKNLYILLIDCQYYKKYFDYEKLINEVTLTQQRKLETVLLFADAKYGFVSSSTVKELARFQGLVNDYVPLQVKSAIEGKLGQTIIGVTGTIGSGKSTLCRLLVKLMFDEEVHYINMDEVANQIWEKKNELSISTVEEIFNTFGTRDRKELGDIVFSDPVKLKKLNEIFREPILTLLRERMFGLKGTILLEGALLAEMNWLFLCNNRVILVETPSDKTHTERLKSRGYSDEQIVRRIASQYSFEEKKAIIEESIKRDDFGVCSIYNTERLAPFTYTDALKLLTYVRL